jgi:DNA repair protein RecO (recombination protein O)
MQWTDHSILLSTRKYGENSALIRVLSLQNGVYSGVIRGIHSKTNRGILQPGNIVGATWQARLSEQLGMFKCELIEANTAHIMHDGERLNALSSACALIESALPERHPYPRLYSVFQSFLHTLRDTEVWLEHYVRLELEVLSESGFGLDLRTCAATGTTDKLIYVSPKSGRAVSQLAGEPYHDKMLPLPPFLLGVYKKNRVESSEILDGLHLTGYFLDQWLFAPHNKKIPATRARLIASIRELFKVKEHHGAEA